MFRKEFDVQLAVGICLRPVMDFQGSVATVKQKTNKGWKNLIPKRRIINFVQPPQGMTGTELKAIKRQLGYTTAQMAYALGVSYSCFVKAQADDVIKMPLAMAVRYYLLTANLDGVVSTPNIPSSYRLHLEKR